MGSAAKRLHSAVFACARWCTISVSDRQGWQVCAGVARAQAAGPTMPGTLCGQPADGPRPPALRLCMLHVFKLNFTQLGSSWHATLGLNGLCVAVFTGMGAKPLRSAGRLLGVWLSLCVQRWRGSLGFPGQGDGPETCASCPGPEAQGCMGVAGGRQVTSSGCPRAKCPLHTRERKPGHGYEWLSCRLPIRGS